MPGRLQHWWWRLAFWQRMDLAQQIAALGWLRWLLPLMAVPLALAGLRQVWWLPACLLPALGLWGAMDAWQQGLRRQFVRESAFPPHLAARLRAQYPSLSERDADLVLRGLRQFCMAHLRSRRRFVAMPSRVVDAAWHEFILHTRAYDRWCRTAFGRLLHHTPAEVLGHSPQRNNGLRRTWYWACREESIDPRTPTRLPLLFALDSKFNIPGGYHYLPDCRDIQRQSGSDVYCGTSFGSSSSSDGGSAPGDAGSFGGSEGAASADGADGGGCGGGCGGGGD